jgi:hypothetical protein
MWRKLEHEPL